MFSLRSTFALITAMTVFALAEPAVAQQAKTPPASTPKPAAGPVNLPAPKLAIIDVDRIMRDASAAKAVREQLEKQRASFQTQIEKKEGELRNANQELARQRTILSAEAFNQKRAEFEKQVSAVQQQVQTLKRQLDQMRGNAMQQVTQALNGIIAEYAKEADYNVVLPASQVVLADRAFDITQPILERLDKKLPSVKVSAK